MFPSSKYLKAFIVIILIGWFSAFVVQNIDLTTADIGRHIKNGEFILSGNQDVLTTNFYSYTNSEHPFVNHHWLSGVIFYLIYSFGGFKLLHLFFIALFAIAFLLFFDVACKKSGFITAMILSVLLIPLMADRTEIRPEVFTYVFSAIFLWILWHWRQGKISSNYLFVLPFIQVLWVNLHVYFFLGFLITGAFLLEKVITRSRKTALKKLAGVLVLLGIASVINPHGIDGAFYPFRIYNNHGYRILEEQSVWFLENLNIFNPGFVLFKIVLLLLVLSFIFVLIKNAKQFSWVDFFLGTGFAILALIAIRNVPLFALFALPVIAQNIKVGAGRKIIARNAYEQIAVGIYSLVIAVLVLINYSSYGFFRPINFGLGVIPGRNASANFFKENNLEGPIFNNYDIGAYLIYHFFPQEKVFVDNRPEAYPESFFKQIYIPIQQNDDKWQSAQEKYYFNTIFFYLRDATPWGQDFLISRVKDKSWVPVFANRHTIIFLKRNDKNSEIIQKYEIQETYFNIIKTK